MNPCEICGETVAHEHSFPAAVSPIEAPPKMTVAHVDAMKHAFRIAAQAGFGVNGAGAACMEIQDNIESQASGQRVVVDRAELLDLHKKLRFSHGADSGSDATITDCIVAIDRWLSHSSPEETPMSKHWKPNMSHGNLIAPSTGESVPSEPHKHRCMRCKEEFDCYSPGICTAQYDVLPSIVLPNKQIIEHCPMPANSALWKATRYSVVREASDQAASPTQGHMKTIEHTPSEPPRCNCGSGPAGGHSRTCNLYPTLPKRPEQTVIEQMGFGANLDGQLGVAEAQTVLSNPNPAASAGDTPSEPPTVVCARCGERGHSGPNCPIYGKPMEPPVSSSTPPEINKVQNYLACGGDPSLLEDDSGFDVDAVRRKVNLAQRYLGQSIRSQWVHEIITTDFLAACDRITSLENQLREVTAEWDRESRRYITAIRSLNEDIAKLESSLSLAMTVVEAARSIVPADSEVYHTASPARRALHKAVRDFYAASRISSPDNPRESENGNR